MKKMLLSRRPDSRSLRCTLLVSVLLCTLSSMAAPPLVPVKYVTMGGAGVKNGASWSSAYDSVGFRAALRSAGSGVTFWVKAGTYKPANNRDSAFTIPSGVKVYGGFAGNETVVTARKPRLNVTILSGDIGTPGNNADNCYNVIRIRDASNTTTIDGFSVLHGNANKASGNTNQNSGGGIYIYDDGTTSNSVSDPIIANCLFMGDSAVTDGGAIYLNGLLHYFSNPTIINCVFTNNYAYQGAAIEDDDGSPTITNCLFANNVSSYGCIYSEADHHNIVSVFDNCTFSNNRAIKGAAMYCTQDNPYTCNITLNNCILWNDSATTSNNEIYKNSTTLTINYSDIKGGWTGTGNINIDPLFLSSTNYRLQTGSACIDAGNNTYIPSGILVDLDSNARTQNGVVDMGAYEGGTCLVLTGASIVPMSSTVCSGGKATFSLAGIQYNANTQWQYSTDLSGGGTWVNFGTANKDTASLNNLLVNTLVKAIVSNTCTSAFSSTGSLIRISKPAVLSVINITAGTATAKWTPVYGALTYKLYFNGSIAYRGADTSFNLTGLASCPTDSIMVEPNTATCPGSDANSNIVSFRTAYKPVILTLAASSGNIQAQWHGGVGPYTLYVGYVGSARFTKYSVKDTTYTLTSFTSGITMIAYVTDQGSTCPLKTQSNYAYYNTPGGTCTIASPTNIKHHPTTTSDTITWTGSASKYYIYHKGVTDIQWWHSPDSSTTNSFVMTGMDPSWCRVFFITNYCGNQPGYSSAIDTSCTSDPCPTPSNLTLSTPTCNSFTATWNAVPGATRYIVKFWYASGTDTFRGSNYSFTNSWSPKWGYTVPKNTTVKMYIMATGCNGGFALSAPTPTRSINTLSIGCKTDGENNDYLNTTALSPLNIYPNPNNGNFTIDLATNNTTDNAIVQVVNTLGEQVSNIIITNNTGYIHSPISVDHLAAGVYLVKVIVGHDTYVSKIIVQK